VQTQDRNDALATRLEGVLARSESLGALLEEPGALLEALQPCFHGLLHYLADDDIRAKDEEYRRMQEDELRLMIRLLRDGADARRLSRIDFLRHTDE
jgi:hypothetical protein